MKRTNRIKNILFFTVLGVLAVIGAIWPLRPQVSEVEKRKLTPFPQLTLAGVMDGSFTGEIDKWYADTYPLRDVFIRGANRLKSLYGNRTVTIIGNGDHGDDIPDVTSGPTDATSPASAPTETAATQPTETLPPDTVPPDTGGPVTDGEVLGSIFVSGDSAYSLFYFNRTGADRYAQAINRAHRLLGGNVNIYSIAIPLSSGILFDKSLQEDIGLSDERAAIEYINGLMDPGVHGLNIYDVLKAHDDEYLYFRTDHHWTALGAYYAYTELCREKGVAPHTLDQFEEKTFTGFLGSFYSKTLSEDMKGNPDTVKAYVPMGTNRMVYADKNGKETNWDIIHNVDGYKTGAKYYCFSGSDQPYSYAHNPQITDGSSCVVIKDSFGNAFIPFLIDHYEHVYWIDFRYYNGTLTDLVREKGIGDVIFCLNLDNTTSNGAVGLVDRLIPED